MADDVFGILGTVQGNAFRVEEAVAEGGFAVIYRAYHGAFRASVALKCLKVPGSLSKKEQKEFLEKFREEAELLFRLSSAIPNIVRPLHVGTLSQSNGRFVPFIAIEWLDGQTLDRIVTQRAERGEPPLSIERTFQLLTPVAHALDRAHKFPGPSGTLSIVHRDLKPENIFIANVHGNEVPKILDFGIAKVKSAATQIVGRQSASESTLTAFSPAYGAPEQWVPKRFGQTGPWTDVWGLALTMVECVTGHSPFEGDTTAIMGSAIDPSRRPTPRNEGGLVPDDVEDVFAQALAVDPKERFVDVGAFWSALDTALHGRQTTANANSYAAQLPNDAPDVYARTVARDGPWGGDVPDLVVSSSPKNVRAPEASRRKNDAAPQPRARPRDEHSFGQTYDLEGADGPAPALDVLEGVGLGSADAARPRARRAPQVAVAHALGASKLDLKKPIQLLAVAVLLMAGDWAYAAFTGEVLRLGPARTIWIAGPLAVVGSILLVSRLLNHEG